MNVEVELEENTSDVEVEFDEINNVSAGDYERGYAAGYEVGNTEGYTKGHTEGMADGAEDLILRNIKRFSSDKVITVKTCAFQDCSELVELNIPNLTSIPISMCQNCPKIKKIAFPKVTTEVGISAFQMCTSLEYADVGGATKIGAAAFYGCKALSTLIIRGSAVAPMGNSNAIHNSLIYHGKGFVYVPDNLVETYKAATNWSTYAAQIRAIEDYPEITGGAT